jgi:hypothetical protein
MNIFMKLPLVLLLLFISCIVSANFKDDDPWFTSKDLLIKNKTFFELFGGAVYPDMKYSDKSPSNIEHNPFFSWDAGISLRFQRGKWFSFVPRFTFLGQGVSMNDELKYRLIAKYVSFTFPVEIQLDLSKEMNKSTPKIFFYLGPYIATPISVNIITKGSSKWLLNSEMNKINYGAEAGIGFRIPTFTLEGRSNINLRLSYMRGLNDTYSVYEKGIQDQSKRAQLYINDGKRFNSGIKLTVCIEIPLKAKKYVSFTAGGNGKKNYKRVVVVDEK